MDFFQRNFHIIWREARLKTVAGLLYANKWENYKLYGNRKEIEIREWRIIKKITYILMRFKYHYFGTIARIWIIQSSPYSLFVTNIPINFSWYRIEKLIWVVVKFRINDSFPHMSRVKYSFYVGRSVGHSISSTKFYFILFVYSYV